MRSNKAQPHIVIIGAGIAGICMGIRLKKAGIHSFTIIEKAASVGGTWRENSYPGAACDIPSHLYSYSFEPNPNWSREYAPHDEIRRYLEYCATKYQLIAHIRFNTQVDEARYDESAAVWHVHTADGSVLTTDLLVSGTGQLNRPQVPTIPGLDAFTGDVFHSARWNHGAELQGKRIAVIGNGASAIQFVPQIAPKAKQLTIFQRSANWIVPRNAKDYTPAQRRVFRRLPWLNRLYRWKLFVQRELRFSRMKKDTRLNRALQDTAKQYLDSRIKDPVLRAKLTPDYPVGCKRLLISDDYYPALNRPNVDVENTGVSRIEPDAVVAGDGTRYAADAIVLATGFAAQDFLAPIQIIGRNGRSLHETWSDGAEAYLGMSVSGFPNMFILYGPNTNLGHNSIIFMVESQVRYVMKCIEAWQSQNLKSLEVKPDVVTDFNASVQQAIGQTTWAAGCGSWYKTEGGKVVNNWSSYATAYWWQTRQPDWQAFRLERREGAAQSELHTAVR